MADEGEVEARIVAWDVRTLGRKVECQSSFCKVTTSLHRALFDLKEEVDMGRGAINKCVEAIASINLHSKRAVRGHSATPDPIGSRKR